MKRSIPLLAVVVACLVLAPAALAQSRLQCCPGGGGPGGGWGGAPMFFATGSVSSIDSSDTPNTVTVAVDRGWPDLGSSITANISDDTQLFSVADNQSSAITMAGVAVGDQVASAARSIPARARRSTRPLWSACACRACRTSSVWAASRPPIPQTPPTPSPWPSTTAGLTWARASSSTSAATPSSLRPAAVSRLPSPWPGSRSVTGSPSVARSITARAHRSTRPLGSACACPTSSAWAPSRHVDTSDTPNTITVAVDHGRPDLSQSTITVIITADTQLFSFSDGQKTAITLGQIKTSTRSPLRHDRYQLGLAGLHRQRGL